MRYSGTGPERVDPTLAVVLVVALVAMAVASFFL